MPPSALLSVALAMALAACAGTASLPDGPPAARGTLSDVRHSATGSGLTVEADGGACGMAATADDRTRVLRRSPGGRLALVGVGAAGVGALEAGDRVAVWADGPVLESCPLQGRAAVVVVEGRGAPDAAALLGRWVHAVEEDGDGIEVYRRGDPDRFPPRMYRQRYVFAEGGRAEALVPHPADAHYLAEGTWSLEADRLVVRYEGRTDRLRVVEVTPDRLRVAREGG